MTVFSSPTRRLGCYMRAVARTLNDAPMDEGRAFRAMAHPRLVFDRSAQVGESISGRAYAGQTLRRLAARGIAREVEGGFVRGENWNAAAKFYGWIG